MGNSTADWTLSCGLYGRLASIGPRLWLLLTELIAQQALVLDKLLAESMVGRIELG